MTDTVQSDLQMHCREASSDRCTMQYLRFSWWCWWRLISSGLLCHLEW